MSAPLFREAALRRFRRSPWQPPLLSRPVSGATLATLSALAVVGMAVFASSFEFARKEHAAGYLKPAGGWARVTVRHPAVVRRRFVEAGDVVEAGDALFELRASDGIEEGVSVAGRLLDDIERRRRGLLERKDATEARYASDVALLEAERKRAEREADHLAAELGAHEARLAIARRQYSQGAGLRRTGAVSAADLLALADRVQARRATVATSRRQLSETRAGLASHADRASRLAHDRTVALAFERDGLHALAMEEARVRGDESGRLLAPRSGRVGSVRVRPGDSVRQGDVLLDIMPLDATLEARLYVSSAAVGAIDVGQEVRVRLDAFPYERHGVQIGRVRAVSATTLPLGSGDVRIGGAGPALDGFRVDVEFPDGFALLPEAARALRPGMTLSADVVSEYATLADWIMSPLKGAARRL